MKTNFLIFVMFTKRLVELLRDYQHENQFADFVQQVIAFTLWPMAAFMPSSDHEHRAIQANYVALWNYVKGIERVMLHRPLEACPYCGKLIPSGECSSD